MSPRSRRCKRTWSGVYRPCSSRRGRSSTSAGGAPTRRLRFFHMCERNAHMEMDLHPIVLASARLLLRPIVRVLLRAGVPFREFSELAKFAYVEIATNEFGIRGRPTNVSRTAILTGLNRRDVARIRSAAPHAMLDSVFMSPGSRILAGWHLSGAYLDRGGKPMRLALEGEVPSFQSLVREYAPDLPYIALFKELTSSGAIELCDDGLL